MTACERAEPVEMRLDMAKQRVGEMDAEQIGQRRIGAVEIHAGSIRREQSWLLGWRCHIVMFARLVHLQPLFVPPIIAIFREKLRVIPDMPH
jgi:hypothetical protein